MRANGYVEVRFDEIVRSTDRATLCRVGDRELWIQNHWIRGRDGTTLTLPLWLVVDFELEYSDD